MRSGRERCEGDMKDRVSWSVRVFGVGETYWRSDSQQRKGQIDGTVDVEMERELLGQTAEHTGKIEEECLVSCGEMK